MTEARNADVFVSVILPCGDAVRSLASFIRDLHALLFKNYSYFEIIVVDDHSEAGSALHAQKLLGSLEGLRWIRLNRPHGQDIAISAGLDSAIGDVVVVLNPAEDPLDLIPSLIGRCLIENAVLYGIQRGRYRLRPARSILAGLFEWYCRRYLKINIQARSSVFRVFNRSAVNAFMQVKNRVRNLRIITSQIGFSVTPFEYDAVRRVDGPTPDRESIFDDLNRSFDIVVSTSPHPLRWLSRFGMGAAFLNLLYGVYIAAIFFMKKHVAEGWTTLSIQSAVMFFLLFMVLTVLSEYVGKILSEIKQGPLYTVEEEKSSSVLVDTERQLNIYPDSPETLP